MALIIIMAFVEWNALHSISTKEFPMKMQPQQSFFSLKETAAACRSVTLKLKDFKCLQQLLLCW